MTMTELGAKGFESELREVLASGSALYAPFDALFQSELGSSKLKRDLHSLKLDRLWTRIVFHVVSQRGVGAVDQMIEEDGTLISAFDWTMTEEGWSFWNAVNRMLI